VPEVLRNLRVYLVADVRLCHRFGERQRRLLARRELGRVAPAGERRNLRFAHAGLARHLQVLRPLVLGAHELRAAQDHQLAQLARIAALVADGARELGPCSGERGVVAERAVQVGRLPPELFEALLQGGFELHIGDALHGGIIAQ
jgi:hypothetical protein